MVKTAPGSKMITYNADGSVKSEKYVTNTASAVAEGAKDDSSYVFSAADYREYLIDYFQHWGVWDNYPADVVADVIECEGGWSNNLVDMFTVDTAWRDAKFYTGDEKNTSQDLKALGSSMSDPKVVEYIKTYIPDYKAGDKLVNVTLREADGTVKYPGSGAVVANLKTVRVADVKDNYGAYDLASVDKDVTDKGYTKAEATILADYFLKHYQYRMKKHNLETFEGYIITGPEYISLFDCSNGAELDTQDWYFDRMDDGMLWCDYALDYIEPGNRVDRFNVLVAYLDGENPYCVMGRGYYSRTTMAAYGVDENRKLKLFGAIDSGFSVMKNPFNDYHGADGVSEYGALAGQGDHYIAVADVDGDGRQDIVNGGAIVSYDMEKKDLYLYSSGKAVNTSHPEDGELKYGHGDAIHITDIDPDRPGLEIVSCFEGGYGAAYNWALRDTETNTALFGDPGSTDFGRIIIGDVLTNVRGLEIDTGKDCKGNNVSLKGVSNNMNIKWDANMSTQFVTGIRTSDVSVIGNADGKQVTYLTAKGYRTNNDSKGNPNLVADLFGDYREEIILRSDDSSSLRIYMNTAVSEHKNYTLMHNTQYRVGIASQNSSYNQPAYTDYYYAYDTDWEYVWVPNQKKEQEPGPVAQAASVVKAAGNITISEDADPEVGQSLKPMEGFQFDFGSRNGTGEGFTNVPSAVYSAETGFGYSQDTPVGSIDVGRVGITVNDATVSAGLATAASDIAFVDTANLNKNLEFVFDVPAGTYCLDVIASGVAYNGTYSDQELLINGESMGKSYREAEVTGQDASGKDQHGILNMSKHITRRKVTLPEDGQIVVTAANPAGRSFLNAIVLSEYVIEVPDFNVTEWETFEKAADALKTETEKFNDKSEPSDYTVALVTKMQDALAAAVKVRYMALADTTDGDVLYAQAEEVMANKGAYTSVSIAPLELAMKEYVKASANLTITKEIQAVKDALEYWLEGVKIEDDKVVIDAYDATELQALIISVGEGTTSIDPSIQGESGKEVTLGEGTLKELDYSISSWEALKAAYMAALPVSSGEGKSIQTMKVIYNNLKEASDNLSRIAPAVEYAIDFGPAVDSDEATYGGGPAIANANTLTLTNHGFTLNGQPCTLMTGNDLYGDTVDDNRNHMGLVTAAKDHNTATGGAYFRDYIYGENGAPYTFQADVEEGFWYVYVYTGDKEFNHSVDFYFGDGAKAYGNNDAAIAAGTRLALTPVTESEGKSVYTQAHNLGSQYLAANAIYRVYVPAVSEGSNKGLFSITCFDKTSDPMPEITARLNGLEMAHMSYAKALEEAMKELSAYPEEEYTATSYKPFKDALTEAQALVGHENDNKQAVVEMVEKLDTVVCTNVANLVKRGNKELLTAKVDEVKDYNQENFTAESWEIFKAALEAAQTVLANDDAVQEEVDEALKNLRDAVDTLESIVDTTDLENAIAEAQDIDPELYTADSYAAFKEVLDAANEKLADKNISQADVATHVAALAEAKGKLVKRADAAALTAAIEKAEALDESLYTADSYAKVTAALEAAKELDLANATQEEVDAAAKAIEDAIKELVKVSTGDSEPGNSQTGDSQPGNSQTGSSQPGNSQTGSSQPGNSQTGNSQTTGSSQGGSTAGPVKGTTVAASDGTKYTVTSQGKEVAYKAPKNKNVKQVTVPDTVKINGVSYNVTSIAAKAFEKNSKITKVTIGKNVTTIGKNAFANCTKLATVTFKKGSKCKTIEANAFKGDKVLKNITIPDKVTKIKDSAFAGCTKLNTVTIGKGLTEIGKNAFSGDKALKKITIKSTKLKTVGKNALKSTKKNLTIKVPKSKVKAYASKFKNKGNKKIKVTK